MEVSTCFGPLVSSQTGGRHWDGTLRPTLLQGDSTLLFR